MKSSILFSIIIITSYSCTEREQIVDYSGYTEKELIITGYDKSYNRTDSLAVIRIKIHNRLDSFYSWHSKSDCTQCGWLQYRFADHHYPKYLESGFFWNTPYPDSIYQLTFRHKPLRWTPDSITMKPLSSSKPGYSEIIADQISCDTPMILLSDFLVINGRNFWLTSASTDCSDITDKKSIIVTAVTNLKNRSLEIIGECSGNDTTGFRDMIYKSIKSIKIIEKE